VAPSGGLIGAMRFPLMFGSPDMEECVLGPYSPRWVGHGLTDPISWAPYSTRNSFLPGVELDILKRTDRQPVGASTINGRSSGHGGRFPECNNWQDSLGAIKRSRAAVESPLAIISRPESKSSAASEPGAPLRSSRRICRVDNTCKSSRGKLPRKASAVLQSGAACAAKRGAPAIPIVNSASSHGLRWQVRSLEILQPVLISSSPMRLCHSTGAEFSDR
jgi:hypothetical protein